jgi:hypothetical protein
LLEPLRQGVVETIALWSTLHPADFELEPMLVLLRNFVQTLRDTGVREEVVDVFQRVAAKQDQSKARQSLKLLPPLSPITLAVECLTTRTIKAEELARQITLIDFEVYHRLEACELTRIAKGFDQAPNVQSMSRIFNRISQWIVSTIVGEVDLAERVSFFLFDELVFFSI